MISPPPSFIDIKNGFKSSFDFIRRKNNVDNLFKLDNEKFWQSCWIVCIINILAFVLAFQANKAAFYTLFVDNIIAKLALIIFIDVMLYAIIVFFIFQNVKKENLFLKYIIPFNWIQALKQLIILLLVFSVAFLPLFLVRFIQFFTIIIVVFTLWRLGKEEIILSGWGSVGMILLSGFVQMTIIILFFVSSQISK